MSEYKVSSVSDYVEVLEKLKGLGDLWFRGVADKSYTSIPGIFHKGLSEYESALTHGFLTSYKGYSNYPPMNDWELYSLMQHHALPTRLLDWSGSALVALFFALASEPESKENPVVYVLNPFKLNGKTLGLERIYCPSIMRNRGGITTKDGKSISFDVFLPPNLKAEKHSDFIPDSPIAITANNHVDRIASQKGCFTVHGYNEITIQEYLKDIPEAFQTIEIDLSNIDKDSYLYALENLGIGHDFIYQDLDSLSKTILRKILRDKSSKSIS